MTAPTTAGAAAAGTGAPGAPNILADSPAKTAAVAVLTQQCLNCHETLLTGQAGNIQGSVININDPNYLVSSGLVIPGNPAGSMLIQVVMGDEMPITGPLSNTDKTTLWNWVAGVGSPATVVTPPAGSGSTTTTPPTDAQVIAVFSNYCLSCHGAGGQGGVSNITNLPGLVSSGEVVPGNPSASPVYTAIASGAMPLSGNKLSSTDQQTIYAWILSGAH